MLMTSLQEEIWQWVAAVPPGNVATYGQIARLAGYPRHARYVGTVLKQLPTGSTLPWFRILKSSGEIAFPPGTRHWQTQKDCLASEGVLVSGNKVDLKRYCWSP